MIKHNNNVLWGLEHVKRKTTIAQRLGEDKGKYSLRIAVLTTPAISSNPSAATKINNGMIADRPQEIKWNPKKNK